jgi:hypothetical protein
VAHLRAYALGIPLASHGACEYCPGGALHGEMVRAVEQLKVMSNNLVRVMSQSNEHCGIGKPASRKGLV